MNNETGGTSNGCIDPSKLAMAIFGAIFGTLLLCTGFALTIWYLVRNHQIADKLFILEVRKRRSKSEEQGEEPTNLDEVDNDFHVEKDKDLAHLSVAMEMEEIPLEKSVDKAELENKEEKEVNYERKEELDEEEEDKMVEKRELSTNKISPNLITDERVIIKEPEPIKSTRHGIILDPVAIEQPSKMDVKRPFSQNISTLAGHQRALSQESAAEASPEMIERLRMLSAEQFGMLETNRRRLENERRQLRELGVI